MTGGQRLGNAEADTAADLGWRHQPELVMDARRAMLNDRNLRYPMMQQLHWFMMMGGVVLPLIRWSGIKGVRRSNVRRAMGWTSNGPDTSQKESRLRRGARLLAAW